MMVLFIWMLAAAGAFDVALERVRSEHQLSRWRLPATPWSASYGRNTSKELENRGDVMLIQMQYRGIIYLGTPAQPFSLIFDTGSSWLWVNHALCTDCHPSYRSFNTSESQTYTTQQEEVKLRYGMGNAEGVVGWDAVSLQQHTGRVLGQTIVTVTESRGFEVMESDGILVTDTQGLGFNSLCDGHLTLVETMKKQGVIERAVFAIYLSDSDFGQIAHQRNASIVSFGVFDMTQFSFAETLTHVAVNSAAGHWAVPLDSVFVNKENVVQTAFTAIIDSGTSMVLGPDAEVQSLLRYFQEKWRCFFSHQLLICECGWDPAISHFPDIEFVLGGYVFPLKPLMYVMRQGAYCQLLIGGMRDQRLWVLGDVFLRGYYTVFDMDNQELGFAPVKSNPAHIVPYHPLESFISALVLSLVAFAVLASTILVCLALKNRRISQREAMLEQPFIPYS